MIDFLIKKVWANFRQIKDHRRSNRKYGLIDCLMASFAMFHLKDPSLLHFREKYPARSANLHRVYQITTIPKDSALRATLDGVNTKDLQAIFPIIIEELAQKGGLKNRKVLSQQYHLVAADGTQHYCSGKHNCPQCLTRRHRNGKTSHYHQLLAAVLICPAQKTVFPVACEPIIQQDGCRKNDCETNAGKRLLPQIRTCLPPEKYPKVLLTLDALYATGPFLNALKAQELDYIIRLKGGFVSLQAQRLRAKNQLQTKKWQLGQTIYWIEYANDLILNGSHQDIKTNYIRYTEWDVETGALIFDAEWISSIKITAWNAEELVACGRKRWKIENETFNTLKNQGYHLTHNYGHGKQYLASNFALLTFLAFLVDQISQHLEVAFQKAWKKSCSKTELWVAIRKAFDFFPVRSMAAIYRFINGDLKVVLPLLE